MKEEQSKLSQRTAFLILAGIVLFAAGIRMWQIQKIPAGLYWDEMDAGYQAYSFLHTGRDYFGNLFPIHFHSLADHRTPLYIWSMVPFIAALGLTELSVRLPVVFWGLASIILFYFVSQQFFIAKKWALLACLFMAISPWHVQYSRMGFEAIAELTPFFLGIIFFFKSLKNPKFFPIAAAAFSLTIYAYATASLFVPLFGIVICLIYRREILAFPKRQLVLAMIAVIVIAGPILSDSIFNGGAQRFTELSVFGDPTVAGQVDYYRLQASLSEGQMGKVGVQPNIIDKIAFNKPLLMANTVINNYLKSLSNDFLFIVGDPNLRQSPSQVAELYRIGAIGLPFGIIYLAFWRQRYGKRTIVLTTWIFLAPVPAVITTDGGNHATRLLFLFPALQIVIIFGVKMIAQMIKPNFLRPALTVYFLLWFFEAFLFLHYYFTIYYFESSHVFQYGFDKVAKLAQAQSSHYDAVVVDANHDSDFMTYLFTNRIDPHIVQRMAPFHYSRFNQTIESFQIGNIYFLPPGERSWEDLFIKHAVTGHNLYIVAADASNASHLGYQAATQSAMIKQKSIIQYPDGLPDFYVYEQTQ